LQTVVRVPSPHPFETSSLASGRTFTEIERDQQLIISHSSGLGLIKPRNGFRGHDLGGHPGVTVLVY
jgi:hypothetical protein